MQTQKILIGVSLACSIAALILSAITYSTVGSIAGKVSFIIERTDEMGMLLEAKTERIDEIVDSLVTPALSWNGTDQIPTLDSEMDRATVNMYLHRIGCEIDKAGNLVKLEGVK